MGRHGDVVRWLGDCEPNDPHHTTRSHPSQLSHSQGLEQNSHPARAWIVRIQPIIAPQRCSEENMGYIRHAGIGQKLIYFLCSTKVVCTRMVGNPIKQQKWMRDRPDLAVLTFLPPTTTIQHAYKRSRQNLVERHHYPHNLNSQTLFFSSHRGSATKRFSSFLSPLSTGATWRCAKVPSPRSTNPV